MLNAKVFEGIAWRHVDFQLECTLQAHCKSVRKYCVETPLPEHILDPSLHMPTRKKRKANANKRLSIIMHSICSMQTCSGILRGNASA